MSGSALLWGGGGTAWSSENAQSNFILDLEPKSVKSKARDCLLEGTLPKGPFSCQVRPECEGSPLEGEAGEDAGTVFLEGIVLWILETANLDENVFSDTLFHSLCYFKIGI